VFIGQALALLANDDTKELGGWKTDLSFLGAQGNVEFEAHFQKINKAAN
jgi:hypothetical protein